MPRQSRLDTPGALHHIIARGNERRKIFEDRKDCTEFLVRLGDILSGTGTICYAWAIIPNHFHLLLRTGTFPISTVMRRLLTGYAIYFNRRHRRYGHLFQNRYKSILCEEEPYFQELVRYIHLNPLRAKLVHDIGALDKYPYSGHRALMGMVKNEWQDTEYVLGWFGKGTKQGRSRYHDFMKEGVSMGKRPELTGGGLVRSVGGWLNLMEMRRAKVFVKGDERILGEGDFVEQMLRESGEAYERRALLKSHGWDLDKLAAHVAEVLGIDVSVVWSAGKYRHIVEARSLLCYWSVRDLGVSMTSLAKILNLSVAAITQSVERGERLKEEKSYHFP
jgi:putative transposase